MSKETKTYVRFSVAQRIEHFVLILSFSLLGLTGLPQKYPLSPISEGIINGLGGIEAIRIIHRVAATVFLLEAVYHLVVVGYKLFVRREQASMVPGIGDGKDLVNSVKYNLGLSKEPPKMPRYNFAEKMEYWAMLWGLLVMAVTGFMLWNPIATTNILPGDFIPAAKVAHGGEAILAVLAIILWHFWSVHLKFFNKSMWTGKMTHHEMQEEHAAELAAIESGRVYAPPPQEHVKRRMALYVPVAAVASVVMLAAVYWFVSFESTAITTIPPAEVAAIFVPQTATPVPPTPTPEPTPTAAPTQEGAQEAPSVIAWKGEVASLFKKKCSSCHGAVGGFNAETYAEAVKGVEPGSPDSSSIVEIQEKGGHPGMFNDKELALIKQWIADGALEEPGAAPAASSGAAGADTWATLQDVFKKKCGTCHGAVGNYNVDNYANATKAVVPGDPDASKLVEVQLTGTHPGKFAEDELQRVIDWITAGAPEN